MLRSRAQKALGSLPHNGINLPSLGHHSFLHQVTEVTAQDQCQAWNNEYHSLNSLLISQCQLSLGLNTFPFIHFHYHLSLYLLNIITQLVGCYYWLVLLSLSFLHYYYYHLEWYGWRIQLGILKSVRAASCRQTREPAEGV